MRPYLLKRCPVHGVALVYTLCRGIIIDYYDHNILCQHRRLSGAEVPSSVLSRVDSGGNVAASCSLTCYYQGDVSPRVNPMGCVSAAGCDFPFAQLYQVCHLLPSNTFLCIFFRFRNCTLC